MAPTLPKRLERARSARAACEPTTPRAGTIGSTCFVGSPTITHSFRRGLTKWTYRFEPAAGGGTTVTESFEAVNDIPRYITIVYRALMGIRDLEASMERTLERIKAAAEGTP